MRKICYNLKMIKIWIELVQVPGPEMQLPLTATHKIAWAGVMKDSKFWMSLRKNI